MDEFSIIKKYFTNLGKSNKGSLKLSDDVFFDYKMKVGFSTDTYIEGTHFTNFEKPNLVFKKVLRSSISDLVCIGINPKYYFINFSGNKKHLSKKNIFKITTALRQEQNKYNIVLSGGDTTRSNKLSITISTMGFSNKPPILRSGAKINDDIYLTNNIGDAFVGLNILKKRVKMNRRASNYFIKKFYLPTIPNIFSKKIHLFANSSIDISDGLFQDLNHILVSSNFSSDIFVKNIPISFHLKSYLKNNSKKLLNFISNGDDYQILFTANKKKRNLIKRISKETSTKISLIGVVKKKTVHKSINLTNQNFILPKKLGYIHNFN